MNEQRNHRRHKPRQFESDTERIVHRHLANKDDVITEEDIRNIRIGLTPDADASNHSEDAANKAEQDSNKAP